MGGVFGLGKTLSVAGAGNLRSGRFAQHGEDEFEVGHVIAEILALEAFELGVLAGSEAEGGLGDFGGEDDVFARFPDAALFRFIGEFIADGDGAHPFLDPVVGAAFGLVEGAGAFGSEFGVLDLLDTFVADFGQPAFEGLGLGAGDGLDDAEEAFGVGAIEVLRAAGSGDGKGGWQFAPTLWSTPGHGGAYP